MKKDRLGLTCHNGASLTQRNNQLARERNEVAIHEELYATPAAMAIERTTL